MIRKSINILLIGVLCLFGCQKKDPISDLFSRAEKLETDIMNSVTTISECRAKYQTILKEAPESKYAPVACFKLAKLNEIFGHYEEAVENYKKLLAYYPQHQLCPEALFNIAQIYRLYLDDKDEALLVYDQVIQHHFNENLTTKSLLNKGQIYCGKADWQEAVDTYTSFFSGYPTHKLCDDVLYRMSDILEHQLQDTVQAVNNYQTLVSKYPGSWAEYSKNRIKKLKGGHDNEN
ncbi:tetratricopeptide repeat protein [candidate division KSB1 bacterium]|nr:tetratricopeptide repeat protein [candidate division KSB1 bacterium]